MGLRRGVDVPVAERLVKQCVDRLAGLVAGPVVGRVRLTVVVRRDLQAAPTLQVDVAQLDPTPPRRRAPLAAGRDGAHERVGVEEVLAHLVQHAEQGLGRHQVT